VVIETFTFLERNANRDVALTWKGSIYKPGTVRILPCELRDLEQSWEYFRRPDLHKLSAVDATSFTIMKRVLLLVPTTGYRNDDFLAAANKLGRSLARMGRTRRMDFSIARAPCCPGCARGVPGFPAAAPGTLPFALAFSLN